MEKYIPMVVLSVYKVIIEVVLGRQLFNTCITFTAVPPVSLNRYKEGITSGEPWAWLIV